MVGSMEHDDGSLEWVRRWQRGADRIWVVDSTWSGVAETTEILPGGLALGFAMGLAVAGASDREPAAGLPRLPPRRPGRAVGVVVGQAGCSDADGRDAAAALAHLPGDLEILVPDGGVAEVGRHVVRTPPRPLLRPPPGRGPVPRERSPVLLPLPRGGVPTAAVGEPPDAVRAWLAALATHPAATRLLLPQHMGWWAQAAPHPVVLAALAGMAASGLRVVWQHPRGDSLVRWTRVLDAVAALGIPLQILCAVEDLPDQAWIAARTGWWVVEPGTAQDAVAAVAWMLGHEHAGIVAVPAHGAPSGPPAAWIPGSCTRLTTGTAGTVVCAGRHAAAAYATRRPDVGIVVSSSRSPLPPWRDLPRPLRVDRVLLGGAAPPESVIPWHPGPG
jgi:hypothetical protein